jgi:hypothetical protein
MKTSFLSLPKPQLFLSCFILAFTWENTMAQGVANTNIETKIFYYGFALVIIVMVVSTVLIMRKAHKILSEYGQPLFKPEFSIFKRMTKASAIVAFVMTVLVLWGIYLVVTYQVK